MFCSYLESNFMFSHQTKGVSNRFPCGTFGILKPTTQHLVLATLTTISTEILFNRTEFVILQAQLYSKQMPFHDRI